MKIRLIQTACESCVCTVLMGTFSVVSNYLRNVRDFAHLAGDWFIFVFHDCVFHVDPSFAPESSDFKRLLVKRWSKTRCECLFGFCCNNSYCSDRVIKILLLTFHNLRSGYVLNHIPKSVFRFQFLVELSCVSFANCSHCNRSIVFLAPIFSPPV